jgi:transposase-like protein
MTGYFNLDLRSDQMPVSEHHTLNRPYKGSRPFRMRAPDAEGLIIVHAASEDEARDHLINALFDLLFRSARLSTSAHNPPCPFCKGRTQRAGRNSSGTRVWQCVTPECRRQFVLHRVWKGGINHQAQSKKPEFVRLLLSGVPVAEAADRLRLNHSTAGNWAEKVAANNPQAIERLQCYCGKNIRHRGTCRFRLAKSLKSKRTQR